MSFPCLILAAGFGTRMGDLTRTRPKALIEVAGRPLIAHALEAARHAGAHPIAVNGHHHADALLGWLRTHAPDVHFFHETPDLLDSGGAIKNALGVLGHGPVYTLNADAVWGGLAPLRGLAGAWDGNRMDGLVALVRLENAVGRQGDGDFSMDKAGRIGWDKGPEGLVYVGAQILTTEHIADHPNRRFSLVETWDHMMASGRLVGHLHDGRWADVGHPAGIAAAEAMVGHDADL